MIWIMKRPIARSMKLSRLATTSLIAHSLRLMRQDTTIAPTASVALPDNHVHTNSHGVAKARSEMVTGSSAERLEALDKGWLSEEFLIPEVPVVTLAATLH